MSQKLMESRTAKEMPRYLTVLLGFYFVLEFFEPYLNVAIGSYTKYYIFALMFLLIVNNRFMLQKNEITMWYIVWFAYKIFTMLWTRDTYIFNLHFVTHFGNVALLYILSMKSLGEKTVDVITNCLWLGSGAIGVLSLFSNTAYLGVQNRIVLQLFGVSVDPNNCAAFLIVGIAVSLWYLMVRKKYRVVSIIIILVNSYATLLTGSRGGLLSIVAIFAVLALFYIQKGKHKIFFIIAIVALFFIINYIVKRFLPIEIYERLFDFSTYEGGSERTDIWANTFELLNENPLYYIFGAGWGAYYGYNGYYVVAHNTYISMLCDVGIIGLLMYFCPIVKTATYLWKKKQLLPILLLASGLIPSLFLEAINKRFFWNAIMFLMIYYSYWKETEKQKGILVDDKYTD